MWWFLIHFMSIHLDMKCNFVFFFGEIYFRAQPWVRLSQSFSARGGDVAAAIQEVEILEIRTPSCATSITLASVMF